MGIFENKKKDEKNVNRTEQVTTASTIFRKHYSTFNTSWICFSYRVCMSMYISSLNHSLKCEVNMERCVKEEHAWMTKCNMKYVEAC